MVDLLEDIPDAACATSDLRQFYYAIYADLPKPLRLLCSARPYVCPFDRIVHFVPQDARVLDMGCGAGSLLALLAALKRISSGLGCDVAAGALDAARTATAKIPDSPPLEFRQLTQFSELGDARFDAVCMVDMLHHVPVAERDEMIAEAARRTAPGGVFIYKDMTDKPFGRRLAHNIDDLIFAHEWVTQVPPAQVEHRAAEEGLTLIASEYLPRLVYGNVLRVFRKQS